MIERNIFQTWKSKSDVPDNFRYWSASIRALNPGFTSYFWDDAENRAFIAENYPWFLPIYDAYPAEIYRVDVVRYFWLYHFGGVYIDMDSECLQPLEPLLERHGGVILGQMGSKPDFVHSIPNAIMMSASRHRFWLYLIHLVIELYASGRNPEDITGSIVLKQAVDRFGSMEAKESVAAAIADIQARLPTDRQPGVEGAGITVLPPQYMFPIDWSNPVHQAYFRRNIVRNGALLSPEDARKRFPDAYLVTYWAHSWDYVDD